MSALDRFERRALELYLRNQQNFVEIANTPKKNQLIKVYPTQLAKPFDNNEVAAHDGVSAGVSLGNDIYDMASGLPMAKVVIPSGTTSQQTVDYENLPVIDAAPDDVWMMSVYIPTKVDAIEVALVVSEDNTVGSNWKTVKMSGRNLQKGHNLLSVMNFEDEIGVSEYGTVGTNTENQWVYVGNVDSSTSKFKSIQTRARTTPAEGSDVTVYLGSVYLAPAGWAKASVMWFADDVPASFIDLAGPIIESYGWKYSLAITSSYAADPPGTQADLSKIRAALNKGHEIWSHTRRHESVPGLDAAGKIKALQNPAKFFAAQGFADASRFMMWPGGAYDDDSVQAAKDAGFLMAGSIDGFEINPMMAGVNPFNISRFSMEPVNSWDVDSHLNGAIKRGSGVIGYMHTAVAGGSGSDTYPGANSFYIEHFKRWCRLVADREADGKCIVTTPLQYYRLCGIDPYTYKFAE